MGPRGAWKRPWPRPRSSGETASRPSCKCARSASSPATAPTKCRPTPMEASTARPSAPGPTATSTSGSGSTASSTATEPTPGPTAGSIWASGSTAWCTAEERSRMPRAATSCWLSGWLANLQVKVWGSARIARMPGCWRMERRSESWAEVRQPRRSKSWAFRSFELNRFGSNLKGFWKEKKSRRVVKLLYYLLSCQRSEQRVVYYFDRKINCNWVWKIIVLSCSVCHVSIFKKGTHVRYRKIITKWNETASGFLRNVLLKYRTNMLSCCYIAGLSWHSVDWSSPPIARLHNDSDHCGSLVPCRFER